MYEARGYMNYNRFQLWLLKLVGFKSFSDFWKEMATYVAYGFLALVVNILSYWLFDGYFKINELIANIFSWIITVEFAFVTNRVFVFRIKCESILELLKKFFVFCTGRGITLFIEEMMLLVFVTLLGYPSMGVKIIAQIIVVVTNYFVSKFIVFKG